LALSGKYDMISMMSSLATAFVCLTPFALLTCQQRGAAVAVLCGSL
jgi:hypothetical protein